MHTAIVPGSFDPFTLGHLDLVRRAAKVSGSVIVAVTHNPSKSSTLSLAARVGVIRETLDANDLSGSVTVAELPGGLLVDGARQLGATHVVKGLRGGADLAYEEPMARMNMALAGLDTLFILTDPTLAHISSSLVREVHAHGGDVAPFLPDASLRALRASADEPATANSTERYTHDSQ